MDTSMCCPVRVESTSATHSLTVHCCRYRMESRKILTLIKDSLPANLQRVEKASIDEVVCPIQFPAWPESMS